MKFKRFVRPFFVLPIGLVAASASAFAEIIPLAPVGGAEVNLVLPAPREIAALPTHDARNHCFQNRASPGTGSYTWLDRIDGFLRHGGFLGEVTK